MVWHSAELEFGLSSASNSSQASAICTPINRRACSSGLGEGTDGCGGGPEEAPD